MGINLDETVELEIGISSVVCCVVNCRAMEYVSVPYKASNKEKIRIIFTVLKLLGWRISEVDYPTYICPRH